MRKSEKRKRGNPKLNLDIDPQVYERMKRVARINQISVAALTRLSLVGTLNALEQGLILSQLVRGEEKPAA